jgi:hypothetical protein
VVEALRVVDHRLDDEAVDVALPRSLEAEVHVPVDGGAEAVLGRLAVLCVCQHLVALEPCRIGIRNAGVSPPGVPMLHVVSLLDGAAAVSQLSSVAFSSALNVPIEGGGVDAHLRRSGGPQRRPCPPQPP